MNTEDFIERSRAVHGNRYDYSQTVYVNNRTKVTIICPEHGPFVVSPESHYKGHHCFKCSVKARKGMGKGNQYAKGKQGIDTIDFINQANEIHQSKYRYDISEERIYRSKPITIICPEHGSFEQTPRDHLAGRGCFKCNHYSLSHETFLARADAIHAGKYQYPDKYRTLTDKLTIICPEHGAFEQCPREHLSGYGCRECNQPRSKAEDIIKQWFPHLKQSNRSVLDGLEIDLLDEAHKIGIEVNGIFWHDEYNKPSDYHQKKTDMAEAKGYQLLHFWDFEIEEKPDIVKSIIASKLGMLPRVYARQCAITTLDRQSAKAFCERYHLQGYANAPIALGLIHSNELVAVMTFAPSRFDKNVRWELVRFCASASVIGGASKLLKAFRATNSGSIISYANRRISNGKLYRALGFQQHSITPPNYFWHRNDTRLSRQQCMKQNLPKLLGALFDPSQSEAYNMRAAGYARCYDSGNIKFILP